MKTHTLILTVLCLGAFLQAQPPHNVPGPRERRERPDGERRQQVLERWLNHLEAHDPAEHQRLTALREEDPAAFRETIRRQLAEAREKAQMRRGDRQAAPEFAGDIRAVREAQSEADRQRALDTLRESVSAHVDRRLAHREQRIQAAREELAQLEARHQADLERRDTWIEYILKRVLEDD
jgi:exonuclease VII large subunit